MAEEVREDRIATRACVIGVGRVGSEHARILSELPEATLVGVHDSDVTRAAEVADRMGTRSFDDLDGLLEKCEAAIVAVPTTDHCHVAGRALDAGLHVLVEKPLAATLEEADELIERAERRSVELAVGHVERFNGILRTCEPYLDDPRFIESLRLAPFQYRGTDVNVILDLMIHDIDLVLGLVGGTVVDGHAVGVPVLSGSVDIANARLIFDNAAVANITASRVSTARRRQLRLFQASGYLRLDLADGTGEFLRRKSPDLPVFDPASPAISSGGTGSPDLDSLVERIELIGDSREPLRLELESFLDSVRDEGPRLASAHRGRDALDVALRITREIEEFAHVVAQNT